MPDTGLIDPWPPTGPGWDAPPMQPGLGVPASMIDAAVAAHPAEIQMPDQSTVDEAGNPEIQMPDETVDAAGNPLGTGTAAAPHERQPWQGETPTSVIPDRGDPMPVEDPRLVHEQAIGSPTPQYEGDPSEIADEYPTAPKVKTKEEQTYEQAVRLSQLSPQELAAHADMLDEAEKTHMASRLLEERLADYKTQKENYDAHIAADTLARQQSDKVVADAQALSNRQVDPNHWRSSRTTGQSIFAFIAATLGGMNSVNTGGRNMGLEALQKNIDEDVSAQVQNIQNQWKGVDVRKSAIADQFARNTNQYQMAETLRQAHWNVVKDQLAAEQQNYDPIGTTATRIAKDVQAITAQQQASLLATQEKLRTYNLAVDKENRERVQANAAIAHAKNEESIAWGGQATTRRGQDITAQTADLDRAEKGKDREATAVDKKAAKEAEDAQKFEVAGVTATNSKGEKIPFIARGNDTGAEVLRNKIASTKILVDLIDQLRAERHSWSTDAGNSDEHQRLKSIQEAIDFRIVEGENLGVISSEDAPRIKGVRGFGDATQYRTIEAGVMQFRKNVIQKADKLVKAHAPDGVKAGFDVPDLQSKEAVALKPNDPAALKVTADRMESIANDSSAPQAARDAAAFWLRQYAAGSLNDKPTDNPGYGKTYEEAVAPTASPNTETEGIDKAAREPRP